MRFDTDGELIPGIHYLTLDELREVFGFSPKRKELLASIIEVVGILKDVGCPMLYIDGSFATSWKEMPGDWDGCYECNGEPSKLLKEIHSKEPSLLNRLEQKEKYQCDLFPSWLENTPETENLQGIIAIKLSEL